MLTGNGRHRRPRQAPALVVAAGVTGSAIAIPLLAATAASAADGTTWDRVAECESGGSWSANTGNAYFGGLQISQRDWDEYGGDTYAVTPDQASRQQQIAVAEKILADQGTTPWATCALLSGLTAKSGHIGVDTGVTDGSSSGKKGSSEDSHGSGSSGSSDSSGLPGSPGLSDSPPSSDTSSDPSSDSTSGSLPSGSPSGSPSSSASPSTGSGSGSGSGHGVTDGPAKPSKSDKSASTDSSASPGIGDSSTESPDPGGADNSWRTGGSWSLVDTGSLDGGGRHRGDSADESGTTGTGGRGAAPSGKHAYTVRAGDTLGSIADSLGVDGGWHALYAANEKVVGSDPDHITPGQALKVGTEGHAG
ncbi:transglycosylase family protein [Streptomyces sp. NPDC056161]|uniref:LysM peptidoglycan-binding domain-containing protein n=1 Tax=Streptomyces sp. NPDC056161 TaxID=3345732 RepID=UPI0035D823DA